MILVAMEILQDDLLTHYLCENANKMNVLPWNDFIPATSSGLLSGSNNSKYENNQIPATNSISVPK